MDKWMYLMMGLWICTIILSSITEKNYLMVGSAVLMLFSVIGQYYCEYHKF